MVPAARSLIGHHNLVLDLKAFEVIIRGPKKGIQLAEKRIHQIVNSKAKEVEFETWLESVRIRLGFIRVNITA